MVTHGKTISESFQPGTYYIGDPCYPFPHDNTNLWDSWCKILMNGGDRVADWRKVFEFRGHKVATDSTAEGDGVYCDQFGHDYPVDSGSLGILPIDLIRPFSKYTDESLMDLGNIVTFDEPFVVTLDHGIFHFGHITIDTVPRRDDEDDAYYGSDDEDEY